MTKSTAKIIDFNSVNGQTLPRLTTNIAEIDRVFGAGIVPGSLTLIAGEPGIGKSTLVLQIMQKMEGQERPLFYISGEESAEQIKLRLNRLVYHPKNLKFCAETNIEQICALIYEHKPVIVVVDSIQTMQSNEVESETGSVNQIRASSAKLLEAAKATNCAVLITGHVTKDGAVAGPKTLEHLVDVVIYLESEARGYRILRSTKNRFGSTNEIGVFEMTTTGLAEIKNPTTAFLDAGNANLPGSVIGCFWEGSRPFFVEVQALVTPTIFGYPQRKTSGFDINRLQMICAVLFKRAGLNLNNQDIHLNIVGGVKVNDPGLDLAVALAIASALKNIKFADKFVAIGEIGLAGEIRTVPHLDKRVYEAEKLGFLEIALPANADLTAKIKLLQVKKISDIISRFNISTNENADKIL